MHSTRISFKCFVLSSLLISLCLIEQGSSRKCYVCESIIDQPCSMDVNQVDHQFDCAMEHTEDSAANVPQAFMTEYSMDDPNRTETIDNFECVTILGKIRLPSEEESEKIIRKCKRKTESCNSIQGQLISTGFLTNECISCDDKDLCNSRLYWQKKVSRLTMTDENAGNYTRETTKMRDENTENDARAIKFNYLTVGFWCMIVLFMSTLFELYL